MRIQYPSPSGITNYRVTTPPPANRSIGTQELSPRMTNAELATAIDYAANRCGQPYTGGFATSSTDLGKEFLNHLKCLLAIQRERAALLETSETK